MTLLVLGFGYSASRYVALHGAAWSRISATTRSAEKAARLGGSGVEAFVMNPTEIGARLREAVAQAKAILVSAPPDSSGDPALALLREEIAAASAHVVYLSTIGVYGDHGGGWVDEETPATPGQDRSRWRLQAENQWRALARADRPVSVLRLAGIYGPGQNALANLAAGTARRIVKPGQVFNRIHVDDIAAAIHAAFARRLDGVINVTDDEPAPPQDVVVYAAGLMGVAPPPETSLDNSALSPMGRSFYAENKRVSNARLHALLGAPLAFPTYREGLAALWRAGEGRSR